MIGEEISPGPDRFAHEGAPTHLERAFTALASLGYRPRIPVTAAGFGDARQRQEWIEQKGMTVLNFHSGLHRETPLDVFVTETFDFEEEYAKALVDELAPGRVVHVLRLPTLLKLKREAGRPQDIADVAELCLIHGDPDG